MSFTKTDWLRKPWYVGLVYTVSYLLIVAGLEGINLQWWEVVLAIVFGLLFGADIAYQSHRRKPKANYHMWMIHIFALTVLFVWMLQPFQPVGFPIWIRSVVAVGSLALVVYGIKKANTYKPQKEA